MLTAWYDWPDKAKGLALSYFGTTAADLDDKGTYLCPSGGRRKAGRPSHYFLYRAGAFVGRITAHDEAEAVRKANERLAKEQTSGQTL